MLILDCPCALSFSFNFAVSREVRMPILECPCARRFFNFRLFLERFVCRFSCALFFVYSFAYSREARVLTLDCPCALIFSFNLANSREACVPIPECPCARNGRDFASSHARNKFGIRECISNAPLLHPLAQSVLLRTTPFVGIRDR